MNLKLEDGMSDKVDELASDVDDAMVSVDELADDPGSTEGKTIRKVKDALEKAKDNVDEMEDAED
jgi:outer membrane murein-binding lipoprotein Lpp